MMPQQIEACRKGHLKTEDNLLLIRGLRYCRICRAAAEKRTKARHWAKTAAPEMNDPATFESGAEGFWAKVQIVDGDCWPWLAAKDSSGYGMIAVPLYNRSTARAHRVAYMLTKGAIPQGMVLDHLCRRRDCVNPDHLEPVTQRVNILRGQSPAILLYLAGTCMRGHERTEENVYIRPSGGRQCRECWRTVYRHHGEGESSDDAIERRR